MNYKNNSQYKNMCEYDKCNKWYCLSCINTCRYKEYLINCNGCNKYYCLEHYDNSNIDIKNWICKICNEKLINLLDFEYI